MQRLEMIARAGLIAALGAGMAAAGSLSSADRQFMVTAAKANMTEAHEAQLCETQANRADLKAFAKTLDQDHTTAYQQLTELAVKTGVSIPKGIDISKDQGYEHLTHLKGDRFDREFAGHEITAHRHAIAEFRREADHGTDADVKAYAAKMVPVLEKHLKLAEQCTKSAKRS
jgi:putative membrane protein